MKEQMTPKERFICALEGKEPDMVPHFELAFFPTMEAFGKLHPRHRAFHQWDQMSEHERQLHRNDIADVHIMVAEKYEHSAIHCLPAPWTNEEYMRLVELIREKSGDKFFLGIHGDGTFAIPGGNDMLEFSYRLVDEPDKVKDEAMAMVEEKLAMAEKMKKTGLDGFFMCSDYCLNDGPFLAPEQFAEFVAPYLKLLIAEYRKMGYYTIKHTDGNIMPIVDQIIDCKPHALHSLDPQGGVDIAEIKRLYGDKVCLVGNVNCGLMDTGTDQQVIESAEYAMQHGKPGGGYIFSTSNCVYTGMKLEKYELILDVWRKSRMY